SKTPKPKFVEEKNQAKYATTQSLSQKPDAVMLAARAVLDKLTRESTPQASDSVKTEENSVYTGWIYGLVSKDKYVQYDQNGTVGHKTLSFRRIYGFTVSPSLAGSQVGMSVEEEVQMVDMQTGEPTGWKRVEPEHAAYDMLLHRLKEALRAQ
ncbi:MAG: hypothetical protein ACXVCK_22310, partial [Bdellovibrionota bacterium]